MKVYQLGWKPRCGARGRPDQSPAGRWRNGLFQNISILQTPELEEGVKTPGDVATVP